MNTTADTTLRRLLMLAVTLAMTAGLLAVPATHDTAEAVHNDSWTRTNYLGDWERWTVKYLSLNSDVWHRNQLAVQVRCGNTGSDLTVHVRRYDLNVGWRRHASKSVRCGSTVTFGSAPGWNWYQVSVLAKDVPGPYETWVKVHIWRY